MCAKEKDSPFGHALRASPVYTKETIVYVTYRIEGSTSSGAWRTHGIAIVAEAAPYRTLNLPPSETGYCARARAGAGFYGGARELPVRTREQILRGGAYGRLTAPSSWGARPPA
jgi:hypothetical protein